MITAVHLLIYSDDAAATRAFFRDVLGFAFVEDSPGWLIFKSGASELAAHPTYDGTRHHSISLMCDDLELTMGELEGKGAEFAGSIDEQDWGRTVMLKVPGADDVMLYEPRHSTAHDL